MNDFLEFVIFDEKSDEFWVKVVDFGQKMGVSKPYTDRIRSLSDF